LILTLSKDNPRAIEPMMEKGLLTEDMARAGVLERDATFVAAQKKAKAKITPWAVASTQWKEIALRLGGARTKPPEYYEAWYHAALAMKEDKKPTEAKQTLASVMRLSASVGGPEMKQKYKTLLEQIK